MARSVRKSRSLQLALWSSDYDDYLAKRSKLVRDRHVFIRVAEILRQARPEFEAEIAARAAYLAELEQKPHALYRHFDLEGRLLYIGISVDPDLRLNQHKASSRWASDIYSVSVEWMNCRSGALSAELSAIRSEAPLHNRAGVLNDHPCHAAIIPKGGKRPVKSKGDT